MAEKFLGFGQLTRPDIGLLADGIQNLAEIYKTDQPTALRNIQLRPEILDIIHEVSDTISREDLRSVSDLSSLLLTTLHLQKETFQRINEQLFSDEIYASTLNRIGIDKDNPTLTGNATRVENTIVFNGAIQCAGAQYRENVVSNDNIFAAEKSDAFISVSRSSLLNAVKYSEQEANTGYFKYASYPGSIRVRRRSHVNTILVNPLTFIPAPAVVEQPSSRILLNVRNGGTSSKVKFLATKNSPLKLPCRLATGKVNLVFTEPGQFFYGVQIQPQLGKEGEPPGFLAIDPQPQTPNQTGDFNASHIVELDINSTGYANIYDLYMYLYLDPSKIKEIEFEGIELREFVDGKDIGLVGFDNLQSLKFKGGDRAASIKILPIWLKTLDQELLNLDISGTNDVWFENSLMRYWDYRETNLVTDFSELPLYTMTGYLSLPAKGVTLNEAGTDYNDVVFKRYFESGCPTGTSIQAVAQQRVPGADFRPFALTNINLGNRVKGKNPRFDDVFPNLTSLTWTGSRYRKCIEGSPPKINNPGVPIELYNISRNGIGSGFSIYDIGTSPTVTHDGSGSGVVGGIDLGSDPELCHISKYEIKSFNIRGDHYRRTFMTGNIGGIHGGAAGTVDDEAQWEAWYTNTNTINITYSNSGLKINLQPTTTYWKALSSLGSYRYVGCVFKPASGIQAQPFRCPLIKTLDLRQWYETSAAGVLPRLGVGVTDCNPSKFYMNNIKNLSVFTENGFNYLFPENFANTSTDNDFDLEEIQAADLNDNGNFRVRKNMFEQCLNLYYINIHGSRMQGSFFNIPNKEQPEEVENEKSIEVYFEGCRFHDLSSLSISGTGYTARDLRVIRGWNQNKDSGGTILPIFDGRAGAKIENVRLYDSLPTYYPGSWQGNSRAPGSVISDQHAGNSINSLTSTTVSNTDDTIYYITGSNNFKNLVLVNDLVRKGTSSSGSVLAKVISVENNRIYTDQNVGANNEALFFSRNTVDVSNWFSDGSFSKLERFVLKNCRLTGKLDIKQYMNIKVGDDNVPAFDVSDNNISEVTDSSFDKIFYGTNRKIDVNLSRNNFTKDKVLGMVTKLLEIDEPSTYTNAKVSIKACKQNGQGVYEQYTQSELFPVETVNLPDQTVTLTRVETIKVYDIQIPIDENGDPGTPIKTVVGTKQVTVPGQSFADAGASVTPNGAGYYKSKSSQRTADVENPLGVKLRQKNYINIDLGFTYQIPPTAPVVTGFAYGDYAGGPDDSQGRLATLQEVLGNDFTLDDLA